MKIDKGAMTLMKDEIKNALYVLNGYTIIEINIMATSNEMFNTQLWHLRLRHISNKALLN